MIMEFKFQSIAVIGPGVLGGSLALALTAKGVADLRLWGRRDEVLKEAKERGVKGLLTMDLEAAVAKADLVVLAVPVGVMVDVAQQIAAMPLDLQPRLVTDVGSVKGMLAERLPEIFGDAGPVFVGAHPMCGSEQTGMTAARSDLFDGAACFVCGVGDHSESVDEVAGFWSAVGCRIFQIDANDHDRVVAKVSHLPHVTAAATISAALQDDAVIGRYCGNGLRDTTRVASGSPTMWAEILLENSEAIVAELGNAQDQLEEFKRAVVAGDRKRLVELLATAKTLRDGLNTASSEQDEGE